MFIRSVHICDKTGRRRGARMSTEEDKGMHNRGEEFLQVFKKGAEFTQELMKENERLRFRLVEMEESQRNFERNVEDTDEKTNELQAVATEGLSREDIPSVKFGNGIIGQVAKSGESYFAEDASTDPPDQMKPMVCIPLQIKEHVIGVLVIYKLLVQKTQFADVDYELFTLLAGHAATAIFSSRLYSDSERKLSTIQGFLDLLTR